MKLCRKTKTRGSRGMGEWGGRGGESKKRNPSEKHSINHFPQQPKFFFFFFLPPTFKKDQSKKKISIYSAEGFIFGQTIFAERELTFVVSAQRETMGLAKGLYGPVETQGDVG